MLCVRACCAGRQDCDRDCVASCLSDSDASCSAQSCCSGQSAAAHDSAALDTNGYGLELGFEEVSRPALASGGSPCQWLCCGQAREYASSLLDNEERREGWAPLEVFEWARHIPTLLPARRLPEFLAEEGWLA